MGIRCLLYLGSFHLLHLMFDEYVLYMVETLHSQERGNELLRALRGEQTLGKTYCLGVCKSFVH